MRFLALKMGVVLAAALLPGAAVAQDSKAAVELPVLSLAPANSGNEAARPLRRLSLAAKLSEDGPAIDSGLVWRVFQPDAAADGKLPLIATGKGGSASFELEPGSYIVHAAFGRAGATKRITLGDEARKESIVLDAGGLKLGAVLSGGKAAASPTG